MTARSLPQVERAGQAGSLLDDLCQMIGQEGPLTVERYMALALGHPTRGYYRTRDPLGAAGDFTTAPEISQMFGELIGVWAAEMWHRLGRPDPVRLVELGPGRGTLMADAVRAARVLPSFRAAIQVHLVETSPALRHVQELTLAPQGLRPAWHDSIASLPDGPSLVLANEFFDSLPVRQFQRAPGGWYERLVGLDAAGALVFGLATDPEPGLLARAPAGAIVEVCPAGLDVMRRLSRRLVEQGGAVLIVDYGAAAAPGTPTLQAMKAHNFVDPLATPGEADLTAHVDFAALVRTAGAAGAVAHGPVTQGRFLRALGIDERAAALRQRASPAQAASLDAAVTRLTGPGSGMGDLFKALAVTSSDMPVPPGFAVEP